eukprot:5241249-Alexandrium_andersonii.AAC.1
MKRSSGYNQLLPGGMAIAKVGSADEVERFHARRALRPTLASLTPDLRFRACLLYTSPSPRD